MLKIYINNLNEGEHNFEFAILPEELEIDTVNIVSDVNVFAMLYKSGNQIDFRITIAGKFKFECDRCVEEYIPDFKNEFEIIYKYDFDGSGDQFENDDIKFISPNTRYVDLKNDVRDYILLSIPMRKAPKEIEGKCSYCKKEIPDLIKTDANQNINPVWEKLIKAKIK
ncbi:MAG: DUF177 domain-containing protein [Bacteroidota bacterium]|nr:DUF177 domain-containing protein [Bacteroidota bacterium]